MSESRLHRGPSIRAEAAFRARLAELGATLLEPEWLGALRPHRCLCREGHECNPRPASVQQGQGICLRCARRSPADSEREFRERLAEFGAELLEPYRRADEPHLVRCAAGHEAYPKPVSVNRGGYGPCAACAHRSPKQAEADFRARLAEMGATPLYDQWLGAQTMHHIRCANGHDCYSRPNDVRKGDGICRPCSRSWDIFYVVTGDPGVKFGITSRDPRHRLKDHRADGYRNVVRLVTGLAAGLALDTESAVKSALSAAGRVPVRGCEYFDLSCLALILDVADSRLTVPALSH